MKSIQKFLLEFYPNHPNDIVITNKYYPKGLTEIEIYNYYMSIKTKILNWIDNRSSAILLRTDKPILIRKYKNKPIRLTNSNYESIITGRTNCIYVVHPSMTNYWIVDTDIGKNLKLRNAIEIEKYLKTYLTKINFLNTIKYESLITSPKGIHLIGYLNKQHQIDILRKQLENVLYEVIKKMRSKYNITLNIKGRFNNKINLDLSSMYKNSLHLSKYSLTKEFLICNDIKKGLVKII